MGPLTAPKTPGKRLLQDFVPTQSHTEKHGFRKPNVIGGIRHFQHQRTICLEPLDILARTSSPILEIMPETGRLDVLAFPTVDPQGAAIAYERLGRPICLDCVPEVMKTIEPADFLDLG